jgi:hypothetical protein
MPSRTGEAAEETASSGARALVVVNNIVIVLRLCSPLPRSNRSRTSVKPYGEPAVAGRRTNSVPALSTATHLSVDLQIDAAGVGTFSKW